MEGPHTNIRLDVYIHESDKHEATKHPDVLNRILDSLADLKQTGAKILMNEQLVKDALAKIDTATTQIGATVTTEATTLQTISTNTDDLKTALAEALANGTGVTQELVDMAGAASDKAQASADALSALGPVLDGIASKGINNPVPVPVPPAV